MKKSKLVQALERYLERTGESQSALSNRARLGRSAVREILSGRSQAPRASTITALAGAMGCSVSDLVEDAAPYKSTFHYTPGGFSEDSSRFTSAPLHFYEDVPILNHLPIDHVNPEIYPDEIEYDLFLGKKPIGFLPRPARFLQFEHLFAVYMSSDKMAPWRRFGEFVYATAELPTPPLSHVVVQLRDTNNTEGACYVRTLMNRDMSFLYLSGYSADAPDFQVPLERVALVHRVIEWQAILLGQL